MKTQIALKITLVFLLTSFFLVQPAVFTDTSPAFAKTYLKVAILKDPKNLNPFHITDAWTRRVIMLMYQPLYMVNPDGQALIPWLAEDQPVYDPETKTVTFHLRKMRWDDGSEFTSEDVVFTGNVFKKFRIPRYYTYWKSVESIEALDKRTIRMTLETPTAIFARRTLTSWIVQKKKWQPLIRRAEKLLKEAPTSEKIGKNEASLEKANQRRASEAALDMIQSHMVSNPIGLGPFKFASRGKDTYILLMTNKHFFGKRKTISGRTLGPYIDGVLFKVYERLPAATLALKSGQVDFIWKGISLAFVNDLVQTPHIRVPMTLDEGYRYLGFNLREPPMSDIHFRRAVAYLVDKDFIVKRFLHGHGERMDTFVPSSNTFYYNLNTPAYGKGMDRKRRTQEAYSILTTQGYRWQTPPLDTQGSLQEGKGLTMPDGKPMPNLTLITPSAQYDTEAAASGQAIQEWLKAFGIPISWKGVAFNTLLLQVKSKRNFDMFIMSWRGLSLDPDYLRRFFHSEYDLPNQWNFTGYHNPEFDELAERQMQALDLKKRQGFILRLQDLLSTDLPCIPLYVPHQMEAIRTDRFNGWVKELGSVGNIWSFCMLKPIQK
jgi:ABC-type transport system substrate-binding protein